MRDIKATFVAFDREITSLEWMRIATLIDSEGCIKLRSAKPTKTSGSKSPVYILEVQVANSDPRMVMWCKAVFGGKVMRRKQASTKHKTMYGWTAFSRRAFAIITGCMDYMLIKREQAEVAVAFMGTVRTRGGWGKTTLTPEVIAEREALKLRMTELKHIEQPAPEGLIDWEDPEKRVTFGKQVQ